DRHRIPVRRLVVSTDPQTENGAKEGLPADSHQINDGVAGGCRTDHLKERSDWFGVERLSACLVHECRIESADLGRIRPRRRTGAFLSAFEDVADAGLGVDYQRSIDADRTAIGRDDGAVIPGTIAIAEKVITRIARKIRASKIESPAFPGARNGASRFRRAGD